MWLLMDRRVWKCKYPLTLPLVISENSKRYRCRALREANRDCRLSGPGNIKHNQYKVLLIAGRGIKRVYYCTRQQPVALMGELKWFIT